MIDSETALLLLVHCAICFFVAGWITRDASIFVAFFNGHQKKTAPQGEEAETDGATAEKGALPVTDTQPSASPPQ